MGRICYAAEMNIDYCNDIAKKDLSKSKLPELKQFARELNIKISHQIPVKAKKV